MPINEIILENLSKEEAEKKLSKDSRIIYQKIIEKFTLNWSEQKYPLVITYDIDESLLTEEKNQSKIKDTNDRRNQLRYLLLALGAIMITRSTYGLTLTMTAKELWGFLQNMTVPSTDMVWVMTLTKHADGRGNTKQTKWFADNNLL